MAHQLYRNSRAALSTGLALKPSWKVYFYITNTTTPTPVYTTAERNVAHTQPVQADSGGVLPAIYFDPTITYKEVVYDENDVFQYETDPINDALDAAAIGAVLYPVVPGGPEDVAGVTPVNYAYPPGHLLRYGTNSVPGTTDMSAAFAAAISLKIPITVPSGRYRHNGQMPEITEGGLIGEGWGSGNNANKTEIVFYNITTDVPAVRLAWSADNPGGRRLVENIIFSASSWDGSTGALGDGVDITAPATMRNVLVASFKGNCVFAHNTAVDGRAPYDSLLENVQAVYAGKHGILIGTGANTITSLNSGGKWCGAPSFGTAPSVAGNYDGLLVDYQNDANPSSAYFSYVPEGITIIGGDCSYNSRYGWNFTACQGGKFLPSYAEGNLQASPGQVNLGNGLSHTFSVLDGINGRTAGVNFAMLASGSTLGTNTVFVGGRDCGAGNSNTDTSRYHMTLARGTSYVAHNDDYTNAARLVGDNAGVATFATDGTGQWRVVKLWDGSGNQLLTARQTGWGAPTGTPTRTTFATGSVTLPQLAERVKALIDDLTTHGVIGS